MKVMIFLIGAMMGTVAWCVCVCVCVCVRVRAVLKTRECACLLVYVLSVVFIYVFLYISISLFTICIWESECVCVCADVCLSGAVRLCVCLCTCRAAVEWTLVPRRASVFDADLYETCFLTHMCVFSLSFSLQCLSSYRTVSQWPLLLSFSLSL